MDAFCTEYGVQPRDLGVARFHSQSAPDSNSPVNGVCVFDNSNGSLRLTERLAANFAAVVKAALMAETVRGNNEITDALEQLLEQLIRTSAVTAVNSSVGALSNTTLYSPEGWQRVIAAGSKAILSSTSGSQEVSVSGHVYTPSGLQYHLAHSSTSVRWMMAAESLEIINGVTETQLYNVLTGELKKAT